MAQALMLCDECNKVFSDVTSLLDHKETSHKNEVTHSEKKFEFECKPCDAKFEFQFELGDHMKTVHALNIVSCPFCDFQSTKSWNVKRHLLKVHKEQRPYNLEKILKKNLEKTFPEGKTIVFCPFCDFKSIKSWNVKRHLKRHNKQN